MDFRSHRVISEINDDLQMIEARVRAAKQRIGKLPQPVAADPVTLKVYGERLNQLRRLLYQDITEFEALRRELDAVQRNNH